ncbi:hypothetical protein FACS1894109_13050 [Spirochaetia bacterium]|nr:hypothetical protein FACS1894109_13050 [Spirochaetia bacterium]
MDDILTSGDTAITNTNNEGFQPFLVYRIGYGDDFDEPVVHLALVSLNGPNMAPAQV